MHRTQLAVCLAVSLVIALLPHRSGAQDAPKNDLEAFRRAGLGGGDRARGKVVFASEKARCASCHTVQGDEQRAGPDLRFIGDKYGREQLIQSVLEPNAMIHPDYTTVVATTRDGKVHTGVLRQRTSQELQLIDADARLVRLPAAEIEVEQRTGTSLMPADLQKAFTPKQFADLITYLESLKQPEGDARLPGMPSEIPSVRKPVAVVPLHDAAARFDHPVWINPVPGSTTAFVVVEQQSRKVWRLDTADREHPKELFADFSGEATTGEFEGVACLAFHPRFAENRRYYVYYHVRNQGSFFSPVVVERQATPDLKRDAGVPSRRILQIHQDTDLHWGGMLIFGPDGYLYLGPGDAGPQEDPEGHGQDLGRLIGKILRIDVDHQEDGKPYAIPESNPYRNAGPSVRPEIWASGFRNPWRFSFDSVTGELWVGDVGQYLFEEVSIVRPGENHGWNVHEGFMDFSTRYRRPGEKYTPPLFAYRRKYGVSVTGGYVYRGKRNKSYEGAYIFGDFESKRIWALKESGGRLTRVRQIGESPQRIASFGMDTDGEVLVVGYEGTIYRLVLDGSDFGAEAGRSVRVKLIRDNRPAAARVSILGGDTQPHAPAGAAIRKTRRDESYFYADGRFDVELPAGRARINVAGGIEMIPQTATLDADASTDVTVQMTPWIEMAARGWYSGDSHVHLHTGGPIAVTPADALIAARAEGVNYVNLCVSNNVGDDIRDAELITGRPHAVSTDRHLLVFGEEMRSTIYGHMQFFGINRLVEPQYTGFDGTPNRLDFPANYLMAREAVRQNGVVTYGHPMFAGQSFPFEKDLAKPSGAARELPIDAVLGAVHAVDLMSYNSDEDRSAELWYRLLNCGLRLSACVGTDALLDRSTEPLGGDRVYVQTAGPLTMQSWLDGLKGGRSFVTNGPIPSLLVNGKGLGETCPLPAAGNVHVAVTVESHVPFNTIDVLVNGKVAAHDDVAASDGAGLRVRRFDADVPITRSGWIAVRVRGPEDPRVFDGPAWAHTSPVYVEVDGQPIASPDDAKYFVTWIDEMLRVVSARNRYARAEDRREVESLFRRAQDTFRRMAERR
jgi:putative heme-binding domain-containing protein